MVIRINRRLCVSCGACVDECPNKALSLGDDELAKVDETKCDDCLRCIEACPSNAIRRPKT